jgi:L-serine dehydratase
MKSGSERISVLDIFKIGIGPSSSHTMGPWKAGLTFVSELKNKGVLSNVISIQVNLYGSLAKTGKGHGTDMAIILALCGYDPETIDLELIPEVVHKVNSDNILKLGGFSDLKFVVEKDIVFHSNKCLPFHPNGISFKAGTNDGQSFFYTFYSIGGGFIVCDELNLSEQYAYRFPFPIDSAEDLNRWAHSTKKSITQIVTENELSLRTEQELKKELNRIWEVMAECMFKGCHTKGMLPGGLNVQRRAQAMNNNMIPDDESTNISEWSHLIKSKKFTFSEILKWVSCFAISVNEENASFGRVVTAPTNGAAGVIPAVLMYYLCFVEGAKEEDIQKFLLVAGEMGSIFKKGSTISAAMGGCQAEIGVSSAMAAAALTEVLGGKPENVIMAAEIAMEHHLGLTCDPVGGLVQVPCIERNSMGSIKAITAAYLALEGDPETAKVSLDSVIKTMWDTAQDMNSKYKETSDGGLAINIPVNLADC